MYYKICDSFNFNKNKSMGFLINIFLTDYCIIRSVILLIIVHKHKLECVKASRYSKCYWIFTILLLFVRLYYFRIYIWTINYITMLSFIKIVKNILLSFNYEKTFDRSMQKLNSFWMFEIHSEFLAETWTFVYNQTVKQRLDRYLKSNQREYLSSFMKFCYMERGETN